VCVRVCLRACVRACVRTRVYVYGRVRAALCLLIEPSVASTLLWMW
jgi:hypothetical protein